MKKLSILLFIIGIQSVAQHHSQLIVSLDADKKMLSVYQELTFFNQTQDTITTLYLNDWINAYSNKNSPLGKRFSDEFVRSFHLATTAERGSTSSLSIVDANKFLLHWERPENAIDLIKIPLKAPILPNEKKTLTLTYFVKIPSDQFTKYGYNNTQITLKNWFLTPSRYENHDFVKYNNLNLDDAATSPFSANLRLTLPQGWFANSDLTENKKEDTTYYFSGTTVLDIPLYIEKKVSFSSYKNDQIEVISNLEDHNVNDIDKAIIVDKIVNYVSDNLGKNHLKKISVSQLDYDKNPFYGLNQLPSFIRPFSDTFIFELKFLKTYLNNYLKNSLQLDPRKDNWVFDAIQVYYMMKYIEEFYPEAKMMGSIAKFKLLRGYHLVSLDFNEQYSYFYMLMARKNLDQPLGDSKDKLIKFNEKIASKYRAGLSFDYLAEYMGQENFKKLISEFILFATQNQTDVSKLVDLTKKYTSKNTDWFYDIIINSRKIIDYKFNNVTKTADSVSFSLKNKTNTNVPVAVYGIKNKTIVFKEWIDVFKEDSIYTFKRNNADKIVINYENQVPEFNQRNNWKSLKSFCLSNKPLKFNFMKDLENPFYNQVLYVPTMQYNYYDGLIPGMNFHNKTLLDKPFNFDITPSYSTKSKSFSGNFSFFVNQFKRESNLYQIRYGFSGEYFHYAQDASYQKVNPYVVFRIRENDFRDNKKQAIVLRQVYVNREKSNFVKNTFEGSYSIFNAKYSSTKTEITKHFAFGADLQIADNFGKIASNISYRKLFDNNRQINLRLFSGAFLYNTSNSSYFNFALDRPTDYLFDYNYLGRSENTGLFSQQYIIAEGGFKSKLNNPFSDDWLVTTNASFTLWNWIEAYTDLGVIKSKHTKEQWVYDSGIRLNLVTDYFELYLPVYSSNGWEIAQPRYNEKIRFIVSFSPNTLMGLFTRKWF